MKKDPSEIDTDEIPVAPTGPKAPRRRYTMPIEADVAGLSDPGKVRPNNEDHYLVARVGRSLHSVMTNIADQDVPSRFDQTGWLMMVADGMGGAAGGEVASRMAIRTLVSVILDVPDWIMKLDDAAAEKVMQRAVRYYRKINAALAERAQADPELQGMGTTMTIGYNLGTELFIAHVGDSRAYLLHDGNLKQLTRDHTHVQDMVDAGMLRPQEVASHRLRNVLTNVLGTHGRDVHVDVLRLKVKKGDRFLLCTDGLTDMVDDETIAETLRQTRQAGVACRTLVDLALERGGVDNVTAVVAVYGMTERE